MKTLLFVILVAASGPSYGPYNATVVKVKDADTIRVNVKLWPGLTQVIDLRLLGVDTPESRTRNLCEKALGLEAKAFVKRWVDKHGPFVIVNDVILGKYAGRAVGNLSINNIDLSSVLISTGRARPYFGGKKSIKPWPGCGK